MNPYRRQRLASTAEAFCKFFHDPAKPGFKGSTDLENLSEEESLYFKQIVETLLQKQVAPTEWLKNCLEDKSLDHLALFLIGSDTFAPDLKISVNSNTAFTLTVKHGITLNDKKDFMRSLQLLYKRGYQSQPADLQYLKTSYDQLKNEYQCLAWSLARFAYKLNDASLIEKAFLYHMPLLTIASFKMGRPFGINYHNLLGIANNALQHYRSHIELLIHAMDTYDVFYDIEKRDHKKTFKQRMEDYYQTIPAQDPDITQVAFLLFPELSEVTDTSPS